MHQPEEIAPRQALIDLSKAHEARGGIAAALKAALQALDLARQNNDLPAIAILGVTPVAAPANA